MLLDLNIRHQKFVYSDFFVKQQKVKTQIISCCENKKCVKKEKFQKQERKHQNAQNFFRFVFIWSKSNSVADSFGISLP